MEIKAVKFPFAFGGEEGMDKFERDIRDRGSLQNCLIDAGGEVIPADTGKRAG